MGQKVYLPIAIVVFLAATTGADLVARTFIGGQPLAVALQEHFYWARVQFVGTMLLLAPFVAVAFVCAFTERHARTRSALLIFAVAMLTLLYFYFQGHQAAERAALQKMWTAATLSIGLLPFFIGAPVVLAAVGAGALAARFDRRISA
ncbi:MAG TPA: hypothetical protein VFY80_02600 [Burkholderiales bacterium]|nr:hypothetical protein [Burkholderiales bacterium]